MPHVHPLPEGLAGGAFSVREGESAGLPRSRMRASDLSAPFRGVRVNKGAIERQWPRERAVARAEAYAPLLLPGQFFSELTAVALHDLPIPNGRARDATTHVGVLYPLTAPISRGVTGHQYRRTRIIQIRGMTVAAPLDAWVQCAARSCVDDLVVIGDALVCRQSPLVTLDQLRAAAAAYRGRGSRNLRSAASLVRENTDSARETEIRLILVRSGLPEPIVNFPIFNRYGVQIALGDMAYPEFRVLIEYDGRQHFDDEFQHHRDVDRLNEIAEEDWRIVRVNRSHILRGSAVISARVETALRDRGWSPSPSR
jgi:hypothetical protein